MKRKREKKTNKKVFNLPFLILAIIFLILTIVFYNSIVKLNLLPDKYITIFTIVEIIFTFIIIFGLAKRRKTLKVNIVFLIIALILSGIYVVAINYTDATKTFLKDSLKEVVEEEKYFVIVKKDSNINKLEDLSYKEIYLFNIDHEIKEEILNKASVSFKDADSVESLGRELLSNNEEAILINSFQYNTLAEVIKNFKEKTKIIYTTTRAITVVLNEPDSKYDIAHNAFNIYISGIDTPGDIRQVGRSDANIVATVNTNTHEILLTSIPRDYYVTLHRERAKDKLTHSGIYGINDTVTTVEDLLGIEINYYVRVNFDTVIKVVDALGGINVHSDYDFERFGNHYKKGNNYLNGKEALVFSRERYSFPNGDNQRIKNQQYVINGIIDKALSPAILTKYSIILSSLSGSFQTNIKEEEVSKLVKYQLDNMPSWNIKKNTLEGTAAYSTTYSMGAQKLYVTIPSEESIEIAKSKIAEVIE